MKQVGRTRHKLAEMLSAELTRMGIDHVPFDGDALEPVTGYWKSQDCYRWESIGLTAIVNGRSALMSINGWDAMTKIIRSGGVSIDRNPRDLPYQFEANPK